MTTQNVWVMVATPVAQGLGWITSENKIRQSDRYGLKTFIPPRKLCRNWRTNGVYCLVDHRSPFPVLSLYPRVFRSVTVDTFYKVVQVQTSLIEPRQVGEKRLQVLHEMVPNGLFRETLMGEPGRVINYFPLRAKTFQSIDIY